MQDRVGRRGGSLGGRERGGVLRGGRVEIKMGVVVNTGLVGVSEDPFPQADKRIQNIPRIKIGRYLIFSQFSESISVNLFNLATIKNVEKFLTVLIEFMG
jgi:hypothetical protein